MADIAYYSNEDPGTGGDPNASSDSSGVGGGGPDYRQGIGLGSDAGNFNAPGDITGLGFGGVGQGPGGPPGGFGGNYYRSGGGGGGGGGYYPGGGGGFGGQSLLDLANQAGGAGGGGSLLAQMIGLGGAGGLGGVIAGGAQPGGYPGAPQSLSGSIADPVELAPIVMQSGGAGAPAPPETTAPGGQLSGSQQQSFLDKLAGVLGIGSAQAAEAPPQGASLNQTLFSGSPLNPTDLLVSPSGAPNPNVNTAPPSGYLSGAGSGFPGMFAGGGMVPSGIGGVTSAAPPSGFLGDTGSGFPGMFAGGGMVPGSTGAPLRATATGDSFASRFGSSDQFAPSSGGPVSTTGDITGLGYQGPTAAQQVAARFPASSDAGIIPPTDTAANLAMQGVDSSPPGGSLTGGTGADLFGTGGLGIPAQAFPNTAGGAPGDITGMGAPVPGTTAIAQSGVQAVPSLPSDTSQIPIPFADPRGAPFTPQSGVQAVPSLPHPTQVGDVPLPRAAPGQATASPVAPGGGTTTATPDTAPAAPLSRLADTLGLSQASAPGFDQRAQDTSRQNPIRSLHDAIASLFGGGPLGNMVASLLLQLGVPAALIAAGRGRGGGVPLVGSGAAAMRGMNAPTVARNLFPGPGLMGLGLPIVAGQALDMHRVPDQGGQQSGTASPRPSSPPGNIPSGASTPAESFIQQRGGHTAGTGAPNLNPEFASRVQRAAQAYEAETGRRAVFDEMGRSKEQQAIYYDKFLHGGPRAAPPGTGRHVKGLAIDIPHGDFQNWMHRNAWKFGLEDLPPSLNDANHFQMAQGYQPPGSNSPIVNRLRARQTETLGI